MKQRVIIGIQILSFGSGNVYLVAVRGLKAQENLFLIQVCYQHSIYADKQIL
jgi:hypothetical protein